MAPEISVTQPDALMAGGYDGAERLSRQMLSWQPSHNSADGDILAAKDTLDDRSNDMVRNDGYAAGAVQTQRDSIVGSLFKLNAKPNFKYLKTLNAGFDETWAVEFQEEMESLFTLVAESPDNWLDASRMNTLTGMIRLAIGVYSLTGETLAIGEWLRESDRPVNTAIQLIDPSRLSNPNGKMDGTRLDGGVLRGGLLKDKFGKSRVGYIRETHPGDMSWADQYRWRPVNFSLPWGRQQVIHIVEQHRIAQSRGVGQMVSVLKEMRMKKKLNDVELQNVVANAVYAAVIESDLSPEVIAAQMGADDQQNGFLQTYLEQLSAYTGGAKNLHIDGVKFPILFPGTKLNMQRHTSAGNSGFSFEESLTRNMARGFNMSHEEFTGDFTKTNFSSARAAMGETWKFYQARRRLVAERLSTSIYMLVAEEFFSKRLIQSIPAGIGRNFFWQNPLVRAAICRCNWLGAPKSVIDPLKQAQADDMGLSNGTLTYEEVFANKGEDWRERIEQVGLEQRHFKKLGVQIIHKGGSNTDDDDAAVDGDEPKPKPKTGGNATAVQKPRVRVMAV